MSFGWNFFQSLQIRSNSQNASEANIKSRRNSKDVALLEEKIDALALACHAMWEIMQDKQNLTTEQLEKKIQELDLRDGKLDGKLNITVMNCPDCGHKLSPRHTNCFYCGAELPVSGIFNSE